MTDRLIIVGGTVICCDGSSPIGNCCIGIEADRIKKVGSLQDVRKSLGAAEHDPAVTYIDATSKYILPGLINVHQHLDQYGVPGVTRDRLAPRLDQLVVTAVRNAALSLAYGVTTIRDLGAKGGSNITIRDAINSGQITGPRIYACGQMISRTGGHGQGMCTEADGTDGVRKAVRQHIKQGADLIKLCGSGGVVEAKRGENPNAPEYTDAELAAGVDEAHRAGLRVAVHAHPAAAIKAAVSAGVDSVEHGAYLDDECADLLRDRSVFFVPTLDDACTVAGYGHRFGRPEWMIKNASGSLASRVAACERAIKRDVKIAIGTDVLGEVSREMLRLHSAGMSAPAVLEAATRVGASLLGIEDEVGTLEDGKLADILIVDEDPLVNLSACQSAISQVIKGGQIYRPDELLAAIPAKWYAERPPLSIEQK